MVARVLLLLLSRLVSFRLAGAEVSPFKGLVDMGDIQIVEMG